MKRILAAANTLVPSILALEQLGFAVTITPNAHCGCHAVRGDEEYRANTPQELLGLVKLIEVRGWTWTASGPEITRVLGQYRLA